MREIFKGRIKWIILISLVVVVGIGITFILIFSNSNKNFDTKDSSKITTDIKEELELNKDLEEQKVEDKGEEGIDVVEKETTTNNTPKTNKKDSSSTNSKTNNPTTSDKNNIKTNPNQTTTNNNNSSYSNTNSNSNNTVSNNNETPKQETTSKPSEDLTKIANPNDFFYSITGGNAEFSTNAGCMKAGEDIAFIDVVDVQYFRCYEVMSKANTIMGYYLKIFCENGNCNSRYKSMINISSYD